jgi:hypothetical protein
LLSVWILLAFGVMVSLILQAVRERDSATESGTPSLAVYCLTAVVMADAVGVGFLRANGYFPYPWHWTPFVAFSAIVAEVAFQSRRNKLWIWCARVGAACIVIALNLPALREMAHLRRTDLDCVSSFLAEQASPDDFILVSPYWMSPGFQYHYHGKTEWNTLPLLPNDPATKSFPFPAMKQAMATPNALAPTLRKIESTLASGHRLWVVGEITLMEPDVLPPPDLPPAPQSQFGWNGNAYSHAWCPQVGYYLQTHASAGQIIPVEVPQPVCPIEDTPLILFEGWQGR